ncbi:MAG: hypothetical protein Q9227_000154 [Pyrenula ochraceoflavens]
MAGDSAPEALTALGVSLGTVFLILYVVIKAMKSLDIFDHEQDMERFRTLRDLEVHRLSGEELDNLGFRVSRERERRMAEKAEHERTEKDAVLQERNQLLRERSQLFRERDEALQMRDDVLAEAGVHKEQSSLSVNLSL